MPEEKIWSGSPSQIRNIKPLSLCAVFALALLAGAILAWSKKMPGWLGGAALFLALVPVAIGVWKILKTRSHKFELTSERLLISGGVFNVVTESLELYRVKDIRMTQPFFERLFGLENIELTTSEISAPFVRIDHVPKSEKLGDKIRTQVEACRVAKNTREIEME